MIQKVSHSKPAQAYHHGDLARSAISAGFVLLDERGPQAFTLSEIGKRLGVSAAALYRHFADREALLSIIAEDCFRSFEIALRHARGTDASDCLKAMTLAYLKFAESHPSRYALMFSAQIDQKRYPRMEEAAGKSFDVLVAALSHPDLGVLPENLELLAVQVWAQCHGLASLRAGLALELSAARVSEIAIASIVTLVEKGSHPGTISSA